MKKILFLMALVISLPAMAQSMYDGKSCADWENEFDLEVDKLKSEISILKKEAKINPDASIKDKINQKTAELKKAQANLKVAKKAADFERNGEKNLDKAQDKSVKLQSKHAKESDRLSKLQSKVTKAENDVSKAEQNLQKSKQKLENLKQEIESTQKNMGNLKEENEQAKDDITKAKDVREQAKKMLINGIRR